MFSVCFSLQKGSVPKSLVPGPLPEGEGGKGQWEACTPVTGPRSFMREEGILQPLVPSPVTGLVQSPVPGPAWMKTGVSVMMERMGTPARTGGNPLPLLPKD